MIHRTIVADETQNNRQNGAQHVSDNWLTLNEAAEQLGIHPDTLRRWADGGKIAVFKTPGGHRRFSESEIRSFGRQRLRFQIETGIREVLARKAIMHAREELAAHASDPWLADLSDEQKEASRRLGHRLMQLSVDYLTSDDEGGLLSDAREVGRLYGVEGKQVGLALASMTRAFMFFRDALVETIVDLPPDETDSKLTATLLLRVNEILDAVQIEVIREYEADDA
jgi:excisionase family DNA binding protein